MIDTPTENLFRGLHDAPQLRDDTADAGDGSYMFGHFSRFDTWYEIDSWMEGNFLERTVPGAFKKTIRENRDTVKVQFDHGYDFNINDAILGPIDELREDDTGPYFGVPLLDTDYNRDRILPQLQGRLMNGDRTGSVLGTSFRFRVTRDEMNKTPKPSDYNPKGIPERTIREVRLYEFGPVVWPANDEADVGARSLTDHYYAKEFAKEGRAQRAARELAHALPRAAHEAPEEHHTTPPIEAPGAPTQLRWLAMRAQLEALRSAS